MTSFFSPREAVVTNRYSIEKEDGRGELRHGRTLLIAVNISLGNLLEQLLSTVIQLVQPALGDDGG